MLLKLKKQRTDLLAQMQAVLALAKSAGRVTTDEEDKALAAWRKEDDELQATIAKAEATDELLAEITSRVEFMGQSAGRITDPHAGQVVPGKDKPLWGSLGEQLQAIKLAAAQGGYVDPRLLKVQDLAPSGHSANVASEGGYLIQKDFATEIYKEAYESAVLASRCERVPIGRDSDGLQWLEVDEDSRETGSRGGGVRVYRRAEAETVAASKTTLRKAEVRLEELMGIAYVTERLLQDAVAMEAVIKNAFAEEFAFVLDDEILRGSGAGQCLGILNSGAAVIVDKETNQVADSIVAENIVNMWSRLHPRSKANAVWFINSELEPQLQLMQIGTGASGQLVYMPPGGLSGAPYATLYGRPVVPVEQCSAPGDVGDIVLGDMRKYLLIDKGGLRQDVSMHVRFLYDEQCFRWVMRVNGQPRRKKPITPYKGTKTVSHFVTLAARA